MAARLLSPIAIARHRNAVTPRIAKGLLDVPERHRAAQSLGNNGGGTAPERMNTTCPQRCSRVGGGQRLGQTRRVQAGDCNARSKRGDARCARDTQNTRETGTTHAKDAARVSVKRRVVWGHENAHRIRTVTHRTQLRGEAVLMTPEPLTPETPSCTNSEPLATPNRQWLRNGDNGLAK